MIDDTDSALFSSFLFFPANYSAHFHNGRRECVGFAVSKSVQANYSFARSVRVQGADAMLGKAKDQREAAFGLGSQLFWKFDCLFLRFFCAHDQLADFSCSLGVATNSCVCVF